VVGVAFLVDGQQITFGIAPAMGPGETRSIRAISTWQATAGSHRLKAIVDDVNRYPELSETNNSFEIAFEVIEGGQINLPDSIVKGIEYDREGNGPVVLKATVQNIGSVATPEVVGVAFLVDGVYATYGLGDPMGPHTTKTIRAVKSLALQGKHTITAIVDDINRYDEINNQNNVLTREIDFG
jgi:subtilase family serine protease